MCQLFIYVNLTMLNPFTLLSAYKTRPCVDRATLAQPLVSLLLILRLVTEKGLVGSARNLIQNG